MTSDHQPDYYAILGLPAGAGENEIKSAYRRLASACHPDKNPGDQRAQERFIELQQAYQVLSDPAQRARYDHALRAGRPGPELLQKSRSMIEAFVENLRAAAGSWPRRGRDRRYTLELALGDAARGGRFWLELSSGRLEVLVPPGVDTGTRLKIEGEGDPGTGGGKPGDLIVQIRIEPHPLLARQGSELHCQVPVPLPLAALGGPVGIVTLDGSQTVQLPPGTRDGRILRLRGQGMPQSGSGNRGDLLATVRVEVPVELSAEMQELLARFADLAGAGQFPESTRYRMMLDYLSRD